MTKVVSAPNNIRYVIVIEPQLLQVPHSFENVLGESLDPGVGDCDLSEGAHLSERPLWNLLQVTKMFRVRRKIISPNLVQSQESRKQDNLVRDFISN